MKLRHKTIFLTALSLGGTTLLVLGVLRFIALRDFDLLEEENARRNAIRVEKLLQVELEDLGRTVRDYAVWVELNDAVRNGDASFFERNIPYEVAANLRWSSLAIFTNDGGVACAREFVRRDQTFEPMGAARLAAIKAIPGLFQGDEAINHQRVCYLNGQVFLAAYSRLRALRSSGPALGTIVITRRLSTREIERLSRMADLPVRIDPIDTKALTNGAVGSAEVPAAVFATRPSPGEIVGSVVLNDWSDRPIALLRVTLDTTIHAKGVRLTGTLTLVLIGAAFLVVGCIDCFVLRHLFGRLEGLAHILKKIQSSGDLSARLPIQKKDEISALAGEANRLLASVDGTQQRLERSNAEMQQRVAERTTALAEANAALEADIAKRTAAEREREQLREQLVQAHKMEAVGTLAGGIAHDFNNILTGILGHAQLIAATLEPDNPSQGNLEHVIAAAERAAALVRQILVFSRQTPGERRPTSVGEVAREALSLLRAALPSAIDIRCEVKTPMDLVNADATQLHQIFMNLGANAGHAIGHRPGQLVVTVERCHLKTSRLFLTRSLLPGEYICISVSDTGCGMSAEVMSRVFDPFFSTKPVDQGTGLGLAVVHGIVSDHGGAIEVESQVGQGTCFRILLPAANTSPLERPAEASPVLHGNERILLVDDEELVLSVVTIHLQRLGFHVTAQATSGGALECFKASPSSFDAVITDQTMPQMSGLELTAELKRVRPDIPVILATGYSAETGEKEAAVFGLAGIIGKPIDFAELTSLIRDALDRKESTSLERVMG